SSCPTMTLPTSARRDRNAATKSDTRCSWVWTVSGGCAIHGSFPIGSLADDRKWFHHRGGPRPRQLIAAQGSVGECPPCDVGDLLGRAEQESGHAVIDERAVSLDVRGEDGPAEGERLEHGVGHAALGDGAVEDDVGVGDQGAHLMVGPGPEVASPYARSKRR